LKIGGDNFRLRDEISIRRIGFRGFLGGFQPVSGGAGCRRSTSRVSRDLVEDGESPQDYHKVKYEDAEND